MKIAEGITRAVGVAPEPEDLAFEESGEHAVLSHDLPIEHRFVDRDWAPVRKLSR